MSLQPQDTNTVLTTMINHMAANTGVSDYNVGSVIRTLLESVTLVIDEAYFQLVQMLNGFYINSASGSDLDKRLSDFGLQRFVAQPATLTLTFTASSGTVTIPAGTMCAVAATDTTPLLNFVTTSEGQAAVGGGSPIPAVCTTAGAVGNLSSVSFSTWTILNISSPSTVLSVDNSSVGMNGFDSEPDSQFRARGIAFLSSLSKGTSSAISSACLNAVSSTTSASLGITTATILENYKLDYPPGTYQTDTDLKTTPPAVLLGTSSPEYGNITVVVDNGLGTLPFSTITELVPVINGDPSQPTLYPGYRAGGIQAFITRPSTLTPANIDLTIKILNTILDVDSTKTACRSAISTYAAQITIGGTLYISDIIALCKSVDGVVDVSGVTIDGAGDLVATDLATKITVNADDITITTTY